MNDATMLEMLKIDLGISTNAYDQRLAQLLTVSKDYIEREGISLDDTKASDMNLVVMYASWLWSKRDKNESMPRMLRWNLNNRLFAEKVS